MRYFIALSQYCCYLSNWTCVNVITNLLLDHKEGEQLEDRKNVGKNSCNSGDGTDQTGPILDVYDDDDDDDDDNDLLLES